MKEGVKMEIGEKNILDKKEVEGQEVRQSSEEPQMGWTGRFLSSDANTIPADHSHSVNPLR